MKILNRILLGVAIICILLSFYIFSKEGLRIKVNSNNRELIKESLTGRIKNIDDISKITLGQGFQSGKLTISHSFGKSETIYVDEGFDLGKIEQYINENGYNLDKQGYVFFVISGIIFIYLIVYLIYRKNIEWKITN